MKQINRLLLSLRTTMRVNILIVALSISSYIKSAVPRDTDGYLITGLVKISSVINFVKFLI